MRKHAHCRSASRVREADHQEHELQSCLAEAGDRRSVPAGKGGGSSIWNGLKWREVCNDASQAVEDASKETEYVAIVSKAVELTRDRGCDVEIAPFRGSGKACKYADMSALPCLGASQASNLTISSVFPIARALQQRHSLAGEVQRWR